MEFTSYKALQEIFFSEYEKSTDIYPSEYESTNRRFDIIYGKLCLDKTKVKGKKFRQMNKVLLESDIDNKLVELFNDTEMNHYERMVQFLIFALYSDLRELWIEHDNIICYYEFIPELYRSEEKLTFSLLYLSRVCQLPIPDFNKKIPQIIRLFPQFDYWKSINKSKCVNFLIRELNMCCYPKGRDILISNFPRECNTSMFKKKNIDTYLYFCQESYTISRLNKYILVDLIKYMIDKNIYCNDSYKTAIIFFINKTDVIIPLNIFSLNDCPYYSLYIEKNMLYQRLLDPYFILLQEIFLPEIFEIIMIILMNLLPVNKILTSGGMALTDDDDDADADDYADDYLGFY